MGQSYAARVSAAALRTVDKRGGLDAFLAKAKDEQLSTKMLQDQARDRQEGQRKRRKPSAFSSPIAAVVGSSSDKDRGSGMRLEFAALAALALAACQPAETPDAIFYGGTIYTGVDGAPTGEAVSVKDGRILSGASRQSS